MGAFIDNNYHLVDDEDWLNIEVMMIPKNKIIREKMNTFINDIYNEIENQYFIKSNESKHKL